MQHINLKELRRFCNRQFKLDNLVSSLTDYRKFYEIPMSHIFYTLFYSSIIAENSFLSKDKLARKEYFKNFIGSKRKMVASDSTLERNLRYNMQTNELKNINLKIIKSLDDNLLKDNKLNKKCLIFDGSGFSNELEEVAFAPGKVDLILEINPIPKKGKELTSCYELLKELACKFDRNSFDLMLFDGLYYSNELFKIVKNKFNSEVLIKTRENLVITQEAEEIIKNYKEELEKVVGFDEEKLCSYEIFVFNEIKAPTIEYPLKLAVVKESYKYKNSSGETESTFYVITTDHSLTAEQMRYAGHLRWRIENNGFKKMNYLFQSKKKYSSIKRFIINYILILFIVYNILQLYLFFNANLSLIKLKSKIGFKDFIKMLYESLILEYSNTS